MIFFFFFSSRRRHTRLQGDWSSDVCSSDLDVGLLLVVAEDHLGLEAADFPAEMVERDLDRVLHVLADAAGGAGQRGDEADLQLLLRHRRRSDQRQHGGRAREQGGEWSFHDFLLRKYNSIKTMTYAV